MDGYKRWLTDSLHAQLSIWLSVVILIVAIVGTAVSYRGAVNEVNELQDDHLQQVASLMLRHLPAPGETINASTDHLAEQASRVIVQMVEPGVDRIRLLDEDVPLPLSSPTGLLTISGNRHEWRVVVRRVADGARLVVIQRADLRDELASGGARHTALPFLALIPVMLVLVNLVIYLRLRPVTSLSHELDARRESDLGELDDRRVPLEIRAFTASINRLLSRVQRSLDQQKRLVADAAHELRSPLTALSLQADNLANLPLPVVAAQRVAGLRGGLQRMRALLEQILVMARSQGAQAGGSAAYPCADIFKQVVEDLVASADAKHIDIEVDAPPDVMYEGQLFDAVMMVRNLVDNAIRYSEAGGLIKVQACRHAHALRISVEDSGPGIAEPEMARVFDPFYRIVGSTVPGSGLGLAIVKTIADRNGATVGLFNIKDALGRVAGLRVTIELPGHPRV